MIRTLFANIIDTCVIEDEFLTFLCILTEAETLYLFDVKDTTFKCIQKSICRNMIGDKVKKPILVASKEFIIIHTRNRTLTISVVAEGMSSGAAAFQNAVSYNYNGLDNVPYDGYQAVLHKGVSIHVPARGTTYCP